MRALRTGTVIVGALASTAGPSRMLYCEHVHTCALCMRKRTHLLVENDEYNTNDNECASERSARLNSELCEEIDAFDACRYR